MDFSKLNPQQQKAVQAPHTPLLIVAGAGTGKTRTLTSRLLYLIENSATPEKICAVTFTNKAAKEMAERVREKAGDKPFIGTFHSLGAKILRAEARELERTPHFSIFDDSDNLSLIKKIMKELDIKGGKPPRFLQYISWRKSSAGEKSSLGHHYDDERIFERYEQALIRNNAFDFDDLIEKATWLFKNRPNILEKYREKYQYILVDEYQDVNPAQYELLRLLAGNRGQISVVGDDAQMIYGWRHANIEIFLGFEREWPKAQVTLLEENYRSSGTIIHAAGAVIANNRIAREKNLWTRNPDGELLTIVETIDENDEAEWIASQIAEQFTSTSERRTTAVLYRTNAQSRALEQALLRRHISYKIYGGLKFYDRREIKDIVAGLRLIINPQDEMSRERLEKAFRVRTFQALLLKLVQSDHSTPKTAIESFLAAADYFEYLEKETMNPQERRENIQELLRFAENFKDIPAFLEHIALVQSTDDQATRVKSQESRVKDFQSPITIRQPADQLPVQLPVHLSTIHLAKGLEFDEVFLAGCSEGILPHARSMESGEEIEEERRLMYVGMTRARHKLSLSFYDLPSRFIGEIPPALAQFVRLTSDDTSSESFDDEPEIQFLD